MSEKWTNILGFFTLLAVLGMVWMFFGEDPGAPAVGRGEPLFPGLEATVNDTAEIAVSTADMQLTLRRDGDAWRLVEKDGYPASSSTVGLLLRGLVRSKRREPKTADPDKFAKIGLGPAQTSLRLKGADGEVLAALQLGKRAAIGDDRSLSFVLKEKDARTWLVTALPGVSANFLDWIDARLMPLDEARLQRLSLADGHKIERQLPGSGWTSSMEGITAADLDGQAVTLAGLRFTDVKALANPLADPVSSLSLHTFDGLGVRLSVYQLDGASWVQLVATYDADAIVRSGETLVLPGAPADGEAEAERLNTRWAGWFFRLDDNSVAALTPDTLDQSEK